ncbi:Hcp family type VI secretion system effector [Variovorax ginsengisoli]|uniref:Type VI secretion system secreted protein Hcp n=1 Tax=Variovorax ginsengisoli TaxID=363844 RepID=A0ABT9S9K9_9BURK|nr:type VI secretion system tube protein Hcp [Variovorax ginsengisoli]MDP9901045.1 type VI secretion system secreted protein Hcp [Variovorax ginsengisoli]
MPGNAFIKFASDGKVIPGESLQSTHLASKGWLEISDWGFDVEAGTNFLKGTGASVGVAKPSVFSFTHNFDRSSPVIMKNIVLGTSFNTIVLHMLKSTGASDGKPEVFFGVKMTDGFITKIASKGGNDGAVTQDVEFVFKAIQIGYKRQLNAEAGGTGKPGTLEAKIREFGWNVAASTLQSGITLNLKADSD